MHLHHSTCWLSKRVHAAPCLPSLQETGKVKQLCDDTSSATQALVGTLSGSSRGRSPSASPAAIVLSPTRHRFTAGPILHQAEYSDSAAVSRASDTGS